MFSKALFKQSCKANGAMWSIITFAVCFMLACVMLISGGGTMGETKDAIQDAIIQGEIEASFERSSITYYNLEVAALKEFDLEFARIYGEELKKSPKPSSLSASVAAYSGAIKKLQQFALTEALKIDKTYVDGTQGALEVTGAVLCPLNPAGEFNRYLMVDGVIVHDGYDYSAVIAEVEKALDAGGDGESESVKAFILSESRESYRSDVAQLVAPLFLSNVLTAEENVDELIARLASFGVTREKYEGFGYNFEFLINRTRLTVITFKSQYEYEVSELDKKFDGEKTKEYFAELEKIKTKLIGGITASLLETLPAEVSNALKEVGELDLFSLIVGSVYYKLAGLLLPIIYMIMVSNNLIAGQVDSGSMAYILSTSTKRETVVFTQALFLIGSLLAMFVLSTITGVVCLAAMSAKHITLGYGRFILINVGAFLVLFALSGLCYFTSCYFDRSKRSMAIGGGLSIFALVAAMLGLFGSEIIPSVVRLDSLNYFNYVTIISLFDVTSIIDGNLAYLWKLAILLAGGLCGYISGSLKFVKKDLPL